MCLMVGMGISSWRTTTLHRSEMDIESIYPSFGFGNAHHIFGEAVVRSGNHDNRVLPLIVDADRRDSRGYALFPNHIVQNHSICFQVLSELLSIRVISHYGNKSHMLLVFAQLRHRDGLVGALSSASGVEAIPDDGFSYG